MVASSWYSPLLANVFIWIVTKGGDSLFIDPLAEQAAAFRSGPVFFGQTYCPHCDATHEWFARDAWVCDFETSDEAEHARQHCGTSA